MWKNATAILELDSITAIQYLARRLGPAELSTADAIRQAYGHIYASLRMHASTLAFIDRFRVLAVLALCAIPMMFWLPGSNPDKERQYTGEVAR